MLDPWPMQMNGGAERSRRASTTRRRGIAVPSVLAAFVVVTALAAPVEAAPALNFGLASEFGRGFGAGLEFGHRNTMVLGFGFGGSIGGSTDGPWVGALMPGAALGFRHYLGSWFVGPSAGVNRIMPLGRGSVGWSFSALVDGGYRWRWGTNRAWNTRLGLSLGGSLWEGTLSPTAALTFSVGFR